jgi:hypothetical protein
MFVGTKVSRNYEEYITIFARAYFLDESLSTAEMKKQ